MTEQEKQIEKMANEINEMSEPNAHYYGKNLKEHEAFADCFTIAKYLVKEKGYRKERQVVEETVDRLVEMLKNRIHNKFAYYGWYLKETIIEEIAKEMKGE